MVLVILLAQKCDIVKLTMRQNILIWTAGIASSLRIREHSASFMFGVWMDNGVINKLMLPNP